MLPLNTQFALCVNEPNFKYRPCGTVPYLLAPSSASEKEKCYFISIRNNSEKNFVDLIVLLHKAPFDIFSTTLCGAIRNGKYDANIL